MMTSRKFTRRLYEQTALVAVRETRQIVLFWARRCRKSTTLGSIAYDELSREPGRTVIAASASLLLGTELVGMTLTASEQAAIVTSEAAAMQGGFMRDAEAARLAVQCANMETGQIYANLNPQDFAELYKSSKLEMRLYHDRTTYSRLKIIADHHHASGLALLGLQGFKPLRPLSQARVVGWHKQPKGVDGHALQCKRLQAAGVGVAGVFTLKCDLGHSGCQSGAIYNF